MRILSGNNFTLKFLNFTPQSLKGKFSQSFNCQNFPGRSCALDVSVSRESQNQREKDASGAAVSSVEQSPKSEESAEGGGKGAL